MTAGPGPYLHQNPYLHSLIPMQNKDPTPFCFYTLPSWIFHYLQFGGILIITVKMTAFLLCPPSWIFRVLYDAFCFPIEYWFAKSPGSGGNHLTTVLDHALTLTKILLCTPWSLQHQNNMARTLHLHKNTIASLSLYIYRGKLEVPPKRHNINNIWLAGHP